MKNLSRPARYATAIALIAGLSLALAAAVQSRVSYRYLAVLQEVWSLTRGNYVEPVDESTLLAGAYKGMVASLDANSAYLSPGEEKALETPPGAGRTGAEVLPSGGMPVVVRVDPGSPADKDGIEPGDQVWKINGKSTRQLSVPQLVRLLSGPPNSTIELAILDGRNFKLRDTKLTLQAPAGPGFRHQRYDGPVDYIRITSLETLDAGALRQQVGNAVAAGGALLLDVRGLTGLDLQPLGRLAGVLYGGGTLVRLVPRNGTEKTIVAPEAPRPALPRDLFVLLDGSTAGAGETLAQLLRERSGARLVGRPSYGMGALPELIPLESGGTLLLSTREIRTAGGTSWAGKGLEPQHVLATLPVRPTDKGTERRDPWLEDALSWVREQAGLSLRPAA
ncbi:MAG: PDZ domain-containing protein [Acidobacteria bacterium]|nr:PDZ domain-containing protein [Acidobacteriota bacterium]